MATVHVRRLWPTCAAVGLVLGAAVWLSPALAAAAQGTSGGSVTGQVTDQRGGSLAAVVVTVVGDSAPIVRSVTTDDAGHYRFANLEPDSYTISAEGQGFTRVERLAVVVREGMNLTVPLTLSVGAITDVVTVRAETPLVNLTSAAQTVNIDGELQRSLPLTSLSTWADFLMLAPGVTTTQARLQTYSAHGATHASGVYLVDGADATSVLQGSTLYSQFAGETFNDIQVRTGGFDAASPLGFGPVVTISTRSGTNAWRGTAVVEYQPRGWNGRNAPGGQDLTVAVNQQDFSIGGPLVRDRWWVFASGRIARNATGNPRSPQQLAVLRKTTPGFEPSDNRWSGEFVFAKLTGQIGPRHGLLVSFNHDEVTLGGAQPNEAGSFRDVIAGGPGAFARFSSTWRSSLLTQIAVDYNGKKQRNSNLQTATTGVLVHQSVFSSGGHLVGTGPIAALHASPFPATDFDVHMWTVTADATYARSGPAGSHTIQAGLYAQPARRSRWITRYNNGGFQLEEVVLRAPDDFAPPFVPFHRRVFDVPELTSRHVDSRDLAVYVQDAWTVGPRLTVSAGVRVDALRRIDRLFETVTQRSTAVGPRLGAVWAPTRDRRRALRVSWGRIHENLTLNDTVAGASIAGVRDLYDTAFDGSFSTVLVSPPQTVLAPDVIVDLDGYRQPHVDEVIVGYRQQVPGLTTFDVSFTRREYRDRPALVETNARYEQGAFVGYRDESRNGVYRLTSNVWNRPIVMSFQTAVTRESARVKMIAGYTRSWNRLEGTWVPGDPAAFIQPEAFPNRRGIGFITGCTSGGAFCPDSNSFSVGFGGGTWRDHLVNAGAAYEAPWGIRVAVGYTAQSGPWSGPIHTRVAEPNPRFGPPTVTLSNGRLVANPLATTIRFAYPTREEGQLRLDTTHMLNVRIGYGAHIGTRRVDMAVSVFNVTNSAADQAFQPGAHQQFSPFFGQGSTRQFPRAMKVSARLSF